MTDDKEEPSYVEMPTLLESLPPTDPATLKGMSDARFANIHFAVIGRIAALWSYFEAVMDNWLLEFAQIDAKVGVCFTSQMMGSRPRIDAFIALVRYLGADKSWNANLEQLAKDVQVLSEQRNRAIHEVWRTDDPENPRRLEATARRSVRVLEIHHPTGELISLAENIVR
jgi:hypothetical protein